MSTHCHRFHPHTTAHKITSTKHKKICSIVPPKKLNRQTEMTVGVLRNHTISDPNGFRQCLLYGHWHPDMVGGHFYDAKHVGNHNGLRCFAPDSMGFSGPRTQIPIWFMSNLSKTYKNRSSKKRKRAHPRPPLTLITYTNHYFLAGAAAGAAVVAAAGFFASASSGILPPIVANANSAWCRPNDTPSGKTKSEP